MLEVLFKISVPLHPYWVSFSWNLFKTGLVIYFYNFCCRDDYRSLEWDSPIHHGYTGQPCRHYTCWCGYQSGRLNRFSTDFISWRLISFCLPKTHFILPPEVQTATVGGSKSGHVWYLNSPSLLGYLMVWYLNGSLSRMTFGQFYDTEVPTLNFQIWMVSIAVR